MAPLTPMAKANLMLYVHYVLDIHLHSETVNFIHHSSANIRLESIVFGIIWE